VFSSAILLLHVMSDRPCIWKPEKLMLPMGAGRPYRYCTSHTIYRKPLILRTTYCTAGRRASTYRTVRTWEKHLVLKQAKQTEPPTDERKKKGWKPAYADRLLNVLPLGQALSPQTSRVFGPV